ncbi:mucin-2-like [Megalops cyprinoides]|uniref:mucin-2-like n=1 Tax=Megalops cyprinoides TaxID=118141 RepID=UPI0018654DBE|nr:mucin-2-like [Megalops cyprinoides]
MGRLVLYTYALALAFTWTLSAEAKIAHTRNHVNNICSTWGKHHFKTFDGDVYQFPGMCEYNLASDCHQSYLEFSVHMKRAQVDSHPIISRVVVTIKDLVIVVTKNQVIVNGERVVLPHYSAGVLLERNAVYTKLSAKLGLYLMWNREDAITLELDSKYKNRTCGLCGDFNSISFYSEFLQGGHRISAVEFGNQQKVHIPTEYCEDPSEEEEESADAAGEGDTCAKFVTSCAELLHAEAWESCASALSPQPYLQACAQDMCSCGDTPDDFCVCSTLAEYSRQCSHAGGTPPNWRSPTFCAKQCPYNMVYSERGSPCMNTCTHIDTSLLCEEHLLDGCFCPEGMVFDDVSERGCIRQEQCQCVHDKAYNSGDVLRQECEECICYQGKWSCKSLPCPGMCAVEVGSHLTTYDGKAFTFHGDCYYILTKDCVGSKFSVLGQLVPCGAQELDTCLKSVVLLLNNDRNNALVFKADGKVSHNAELSLPYSTANVNVFRPSSFYILVQTDFGLQLQIQLIPIMQVYVTLDHAYQSKTCGLCGNFNMVLHDDLKTPQGLVEGTAASFANSWKAQASCPDRTERLDHPCSFSVENENYAEHWCSLLRSQKSEFAKCHTMVDPEIYYKRCKYSSCNCEHSEDCLCSMFSSYVHACAAKGVDLQGWRTNVCEKYTGSCPTSQTFSYQLQQCQRTCQSLSSEWEGCSTDFLPVDGCSCPDGLYQDDRGVCIPMAKCPCYHNGCPTPKVYFSCSTAKPGERGLECARTCRNLDNDCFPTDCESGCQCPIGLVDDGRGNCVKENDCPCPHDGHFYAPGRQIQVQCNTCTCKRGVWECTEKKCAGTCIIYGSGHYNTFDKQRFGFHGQCSYVAVQDKCGNKTGSGNFRVITENIPCGSTGTTCSKSVRIYLGRTELKLSDGTYKVVNHKTGPLVKYTVRSVGLYLAVESTIGLALLWDRKTTVRIILEADHMGEVCGLCGDFDGDAKDDFTTQGQLVVSSPLEFANSWKVLSTCPDSGTNHDPCSERPHRHPWAELQCSIIKGNTFKDCHDKVDPAPYYENCVRDSCACDSGGDCECFCTAVAAYAQACNEAGSCVTWRTPEICPVFCDYYNAPLECKWHYNPCHTPCYKTCLNPQGICSNPLPNLEGCYPVCPPHKPIFDEKTRICVEECDGCYLNNTFYQPEDEYYTFHYNNRTTNTIPIYYSHTIYTISNNTYHHTNRNTNILISYNTYMSYTISISIYHNHTISNDTNHYPSRNTNCHYNQSYHYNNRTTNTIPIYYNHTTHTISINTDHHTKRDNKSHCNQSYNYNNHTTNTSSIYYNHTTHTISIHYNHTSNTISNNAYHHTNKWYDVDKPSSKKGDWETYQNITASGEKYMSYTISISIYHNHTISNDTSHYPSRNTNCHYNQSYNYNNRTINTTPLYYNHTTHTISNNIHHYTNRNTNKTPTVTTTKATTTTTEPPTPPPSTTTIPPTPSPSTTTTPPTPSPTTPATTKTEPPTVTTTKTTTTTEPPTPSPTTPTTTPTETPTPSTTTLSTTTTEPPTPSPSTTNTPPTRSPTTPSTTPTVTTTKATTTTEPPTPPPSTTTTPPTPSPTTPTTTPTETPTVTTTKATTTTTEPPTPLPTTPTTTPTETPTVTTTKATTTTTQPPTPSPSTTTTPPTPSPSTPTTTPKETPTVTTTKATTTTTTPPTPAPSTTTTPLTPSPSTTITPATPSPTTPTTTPTVTTTKATTTTTEPSTPPPSTTTTPPTPSPTTPTTTPTETPTVTTTKATTTTTTPPTPPPSTTTIPPTPSPTTPSTTPTVTTTKATTTTTEPSTPPPSTTTTPPTPSPITPTTTPTETPTVTTTKATTTTTEPPTPPPSTTTIPPTPSPSTTTTPPTPSPTTPATTKTEPPTVTTTKTTTTTEPPTPSPTPTTTPTETPTPSTATLSTTTTEPPTPSPSTTTTPPTPSPTTLSTTPTVTTTKATTTTEPPTPPPSTTTTPPTPSPTTPTTTPTETPTVTTTKATTTTTEPPTPLPTTPTTTPTETPTVTTTKATTTTTQPPTSSPSSTTTPPTPSPTTPTTTPTETPTVTTTKATTTTKPPTPPPSMTTTPPTPSPVTTTKATTTTTKPPTPSPTTPTTTPTETPTNHQHHLHLRQPHHQHHLQTTHTISTYYNHTTNTITNNTYHYTNSHYNKSYHYNDRTTNVISILYNHTTYTTSNNTYHHTNRKTNTLHYYTFHYNNRTTNTILIYYNHTTNIISNNTCHYTNRNTNTISIYYNHTTHTTPIYYNHTTNTISRKTIFNMTDIGSGICLTMICSATCEIQNSTKPCPTPSTMPPPTPPECPEWDKVQNETFLLCNCTMARCIENNTIEIIPYECPPLENITCTNGKKPVLVYDENYCCQHYVCDCFCEGWGDPHYITFDGLFYSFQGNCTYVLMEEIRALYNLKIYIDNIHCDPEEDVSCPRAIIVSYDKRVITLKNHNLIGAAKMEAIMNGATLRLPFTSNGIKVLATGINLVLEIPFLGVVVTFGVTGFSINLPFKHFGNNTHGQCGTCNNNQADDCMLPGGQLVEDCAVMGDYWPATDLYHPNCPAPPSLPTSSPGPSPTNKPCNPNSICELLKSSLFAECHPHVSPEHFYQGCAFDSCHMSNPSVECTSLQSYAAACSQFGICLHWRNHTDKCASNCPADKVYKPCGPAEQPTCDDTYDPSMSFMTEGCFCPDGMKLFNKESAVCVEKCGCLDPSGVPREFNEIFQYKCQDCICDEATKTVICKPLVCPDSEVVNCNGPGFIVVNETDPSEPCCSRLFCRCDSSTCPSIDTSCNVGYTPVVSVPQGKCCPENKCEPKKVCVHKHVEYQPGASVPMAVCQECTCTTEVDPRTGLYKIRCAFQTCNEECKPGFQYMETGEDECCGRCVQTHCVVQVNGITQLLKHGHTWSPPGNRCEVYGCVRINGTYVSTRSNIQCPPFHESNCQPGTIQTAADGCCRVCVEKERACKVETVTAYITQDTCQSVEEVRMTYCEGACNTYTKYSEEAAVIQHSCTCCQESRTSNRTINLRCLNGDLVPYSYIHVEECNCRATDCHRTRATKLTPPKHHSHLLPQV